ncbi:hypothetical protein BDR03DRAFT_873784 [Suillus americanus]|nr:hypothetical protein BDR03DRAFT_873784 [Suillus americanus]
MQKLGLGEYELSEDEWPLVKQLRDVLKILKDVTLYFSCSTPNLAMVIPAMDHIDQVFTNCILKKELPEPAIHAALGLAKCTLNRYYSLTDKYKVYQIAMVLHRQHKLSHFRSVGWEQQWIEAAE